MDDTSARLHAAFVGGFRPYLNAILSERNLPELGADVISEAEERLEAELGDLLALPFAEQRRSPLELVQEAVEGPTRALAALDVKPPLRDPVAVAALPGDRYALAPASSSALGEEAFHAHLAWGAAKAQALAPLVSARGLRVAILSGDLMDRSRFDEAVQGAGLQLVDWAPESDPRPVMAFVDLTNRRSDEAIAELVERGVRVVAFGPHVDEDALARAAAMGVHAVLPRSRLFKEIGAHLPRPT